MSGYQPIEIGELCLKEFAKEDSKLMIYHVFGTWVGYYGDVAYRAPTNRDGGLTDPHFVRQMVEGDEHMGMQSGMGIIMNVTDPKLGLNPENFLDPLQLMSGQRGNPLETFKDMMAAYSNGKKYGQMLKGQNPPDGSVNPSDLDISILDLIDTREIDSSQFSQ